MACPGPAQWQSYCAAARGQGKPLNVSLNAQLGRAGTVVTVSGDSAGQFPQPGALAARARGVGAAYETAAWAGRSVRTGPCAGESVQVVCGAKSGRWAVG